MLAMINERMSQYRFGKVQKEILIRLAHGLKLGFKKIKSTMLNEVINKKLGVEIHPNNFRASCDTLEERGLIMRHKEGFDWYLNITPEGFDQAIKWINKDTKERK
ncbi:hypothetical protein [Vibrio cholerae]|uniref:hypothetical protein n=2 Tax=Vibrio cholerae TaxID=666 RepID=UPI002D1E3893|nr:hypothetical protein [Vibrio cholerae]